MPGSTHAIEIEHLSKVYRTGFWMQRVVGLDDLSLTVEPGEIFGFIGPNGAGKTTTIKVLTGLHQPTSGRAFVFGKPCSDPAARVSLGFVPERPYFYTHLTARELLTFYAGIHQLSPKTASQRVESLLEKVDMRRFADVPLGKYSKGMLQRIGVCQSLLHDPQLLIFDEPMSGLDPIGRAMIRDLVLEESKRGKTIFLSSHILHDVETLCNRVAILVGGKLRGIGTIHDMLNDRIRHVDCTVTGLDHDMLDGHVVARDHRKVVVRLAPQDVQKFIAKVTAAGGNIEQLVPLRASLEQLLLSEVERSRPVAADEKGVLG